MRQYSATETADLLPYPRLADVLRTALQAHEDGSVAAPPRQGVALPDGATLLLMPATSPDLAIVKLVTVHPANAGSGRAVVQGEVIVLDARTGERLYLLDGAAVTARRTAALSLLAAQLLAPNPAGPLLVVGAGVQARAHLQAFAAGLGVRQAFVSARTLAHAEALAAEARSWGMDAQATHDPAEVSAATPLIVTATTSATPVLPVAVRDDAFIAAVGAYQPQMAEIPAALVRRCAVYVDTLAGAQHEAGDLLQASIDWAHVTPLSANLARPDARRPILFKSVGHALWDLAAAQLVHQQQPG